MTRGPDARRPTIMEVAALAGVSHQTVSRYLRHNGGLKPATVEKVDAAIRALDYRPNLVARSMRTKHSNRLAIVLPTLPGFVPVRLLAGASSVAHEAGYQLEIVSLDGSSEVRAERTRELVESGYVGGVLSLAPLPGFDPGARAHGSATIVITPEYDQNLHGAGALADGSMEGEIVAYLSSLGHRRFVHLAGPDTFPSARNRKAAYLEAIDRLGLESYAVFDGNWTARAGYEAIRDLATDAGVTAVVAANDVMAVGAIRAALDRGWRVPEDLSVIGWDNEEIARYGSPSLTTVAVDRERQGREAMQQLIAEVRGEPAPPPAPETINTLLIRESTSAPGAPAIRVELP
ncbi:LacI family DNA-binding transcriptional regulator [Pseudonocardia xinjiangensis]|uniref:LacI family transcriptional regulator n=1 Tax=Pseudonocardia xinjiangensis TaxID=75289 RepID=A0ABX1R5H4_9PSEU|nr:LacI family DNA-binding transcriptional regulator [Pseudonocardia xinjiangensis]NMH75647.1 LacI family transcriptional regulator [Pseudonocardia xinjiangensis]